MDSLAHTEMGPGAGGEGSTGVRHAGRVPRMRLDLSWQDLVAGLGACVGAWRPERRIRDIESRIPSSVVAYSVRSGFDAFLSEVDWTAGSTVLVSAWTIPDMVTLIRRHGYRVEPVDCDPRTLVPDCDAMRAAIGPTTVAWLHAHLFGTRSDLHRHVDLCHGAGLAVIEDCAQAYAGHLEYSNGADVVMYSFGTIKTATALGGAVLLIDDDQLRDGVRRRMRQWPIERRAHRALKVVRCASLQSLTGPVRYAIACRALSASGRDPDVWVHNSVRGFGRSDLVRAIRRRPSAPLVALLDRRLRQDISPAIERRRRRGEALLEALPDGVRMLGAGAGERTHWVVALTCREPERVRLELRRVGFDASSRSSLALVTDDCGREPALLGPAHDGLVYVPAHQGDVKLVVHALLTAEREAEYSRLGGNI